MIDRDAQKRAAAEAAVALVNSGMVVGLGTGSTAAFAIDALIRRVRQGLDIVAIPTSERSAAQAREGGIRLVDFADTPADRPDDRRRGRDRAGPAAPGEGPGRRAAAGEDRRRGQRPAGDHRRRTQAGGPARPFGAGAGGGGRRSAGRSTADRITRLGGMPELRRGPDGAPFRTDGGNLILDCRFGPIADPAGLEAAPVPGGRPGGDRPVHRHGGHRAGRHRQRRRAAAPYKRGNGGRRQRRGLQPPLLPLSRSPPPPAAFRLVAFPAGRYRLATIGCSGASTMQRLFGCRLCRVRSRQASQAWCLVRSVTWARHQVRWRRWIFCTCGSPRWVLRFATRAARWADLRVAEAADLDGPAGRRRRLRPCRHARRYARYASRHAPNRSGGSGLPRAWSP